MNDSKNINIVIVDDLMPVLLPQRRFLHSMLQKKNIDASIEIVQVTNDAVENNEQFWEEKLSVFQSADLIILDGDMPIKGPNFVQNLIDKGIALDKIFARQGASYFDEKIELTINNEKKTGFMPKIFLKNSENIQETKEFFHDTDLFIINWLKLYEEENKGFKIK